MSKIRLAVLYGGISGEHEVSCLSAASILKNLDQERYDVITIGVTKGGRWYVQPQGSQATLEVTEALGREVSIRPGQGLFVAQQQLPLDVVLPITHGVQGEDGRIQGLLECAGIPYCGAGVLASALGMDKAFAKQIWNSLGLPVVPSLTVRAHEVAEASARRSTYQKAVQTLGSPLFVKPSNSGSSVGVAKVTDFAEFGPALDQALAVDKKILIETAVDAREVEVAVLGGASPKAYGPGEVVPTHEFYDYDAKYTDPDGASLVIPADLPASLSAEILQTAIRAYQALDAVGFARVDFFVSRTDNQLWVNEINTLPGFTTISMFPRMAVAGGMTYTQVLNTIIDQAIQK